MPVPFIKFWCRLQPGREPAEKAKKVVSKLGEGLGVGLAELADELAGQARLVAAAAAAAAAAAGLKSIRLDLWVVDTEEGGRESEKRRERKEGDRGSLAGQIGRLDPHAGARAANSQIVGPSGGFKQQQTLATKGLKSSLYTVLLIRFNVHSTAFLPFPQSQQNDKEEQYPSTQQRTGLWGFGR
ncbi:hypothetical protein DHEL01_v200611 [Diaporthe helianthi]|uniref:Uncharacterized protein n=1 Tax=Diaporthe helianthi TaxID=158607 RepID=A0A2P5IER0_DIAHE|nr:hypothetical protein DHEL01_v200611 [Diaporthe helianthi]